MLRSASIWTAMRPETRIQPPLSAPRNGRGWVEHLQRFAPERMASGGRHRAGPFGRMLGAAIGCLLLAAVVLAQAPERILYVSALDRNTRAPVESLGVKDLRVTEDGVAREVLRVEPAKSPMPIAVIVDNQEAAQETIANLRTALSSFFRAVDGVGPVALITVADRPTILQDYTTDQAQLQQAANRVFAAPDSGATLLDGIVVALPNNDAGYANPGVWLDVVLMHCRQLRDVGTTMGYELVTFIAGNFCEVLEAIKAGAEPNQELIQLHVEALRMSKQARYKSTTPADFPELSSGLHKLLSLTKAGTDPQGES